ncbi:hypothetical protein FG386_001193 [Cryptosporidium ryanae]|uniref:uncharacterized protein n=1 Tax=Cryptosporidium ryanae TaxID=515981 RepID=UPI00351A0F75|nr:hypothetical protein FG386_001193 [Cryptosporidium ryanae]
MNNNSNINNIDYESENLPSKVNRELDLRLETTCVESYEDGDDLGRAWDDSLLYTPQSGVILKKNVENKEQELVGTYNSSDSDYNIYNKGWSLSSTEIINNPISKLKGTRTLKINKKQIFIRKLNKLLNDIKQFSAAVIVYIIYHTTVLNLFPSIYTVNKEMNKDEIYEYYYVQYIIPKDLSTNIMDSCYMACVTYIIVYFVEKGLRNIFRELVNRNNETKICRRKRLFCNISGRMFGIMCSLIIMIGLTQNIAHESLLTKGFLVPDIWFSLAKDKFKYDDYKGLSSYVIHTLLYTTGLFVDFYGFITALKMVFTYVHLLDMSILFSYLTLVVVIGLPLMQEGLLGPKNKCNANDYHWYKFNTTELTFFKTFSGNIHTGDFRGPTSTNYPPLFYSEYVTMDDGIKIAVDVYLPRVKFLYKSLPTIVDITRYNRRMDVHWPFTLFSLWGEPRSTSMNIWSWQITQTFIPNNYAVVVVDTRGTGASTGHRVVDFSNNEVNDFRQIIEWIKNQPWSNRKIGVGGISYDGMAAIKTASSSPGDKNKGGGDYIEEEKISFRNERNLVDAVFALTSPMNVIKELIEPGGLICKPFVEDYFSITYSFEQYGTPLLHFLKTIRYYPFKLVIAFLLVLGNVSPVQGYKSIKKQALEMHQKNWNMSKTIKKYKHIDEPVELDDGTLINAEKLGNTEEIAQLLGNKGVSVYLTTGYCDSANSRGVLQFYDSLIESSSKAYEKYLLEAGNKTPKDKPHYKLILGPWTHSGRSSCSPFGETISCFEPSLYYDLVRFMDCILKGVCWGKEEKNIHYYQVGEEKWYTTDKFPPQDTDYLKFTIEKNIQSDKISTTSQELLVNQQNTRLVQLVYTDKKEIKNGSNTNSSGNYLQIKVDDNYFSEYRTRWMIAMHPFRVTVSYNEGDKMTWHAGERYYQKRNNRQYIRFATSPFNKQIRLIGSVWLNFSVQLMDGYDAPLYVYLEDISPDNKIKYITEGIAQIGHRHVNMTKSALENIPHGSARKVIRPLTKNYYQPLQKIGDEIGVQITLEPITWTFFKGHKLSILITGADSRNFKLHHIYQNVKIAKTINVKLDNTFMVKLPVIREDYNKWNDL